MIAGVGGGRELGGAEWQFKFGGRLSPKKIRDANREGRQLLYPLIIFSTMD